MTTVDFVQTWREHTVAIVNADSELRTLMGRTSGLILPWESFTIDSPTPVIAYLTISGGKSRAHNTRAMSASFAVHAGDMHTANTICARLEALLKYPAYGARGANIGRDSGTDPVRSWPSADAREDDAAIARADIDLSFLIAG